jgi:hypothetical protein
LCALAFIMCSCWSSQNESSKASFCKESWRPASELAQCHFCYMTPSKQLIRWSRFKWNGDRWHLMMGRAADTHEEARDWWRPLLALSFSQSLADLTPSSTGLYLILSKWTWGL